MKKIIAFYDLLIHISICTPLWALSIIIFFSGALNDIETAGDFLVLFIFAAGIAIPWGTIQLFRYVRVENDYIYFHYFPFTNSWKKAADNIDIKWNQEVLISQVESAKIVKLTKEEKKTKVFYKHWFNKYLKINLKHGKCKYVYVGNYSGFQIEKILKHLKVNHKS